MDHSSGISPTMLLFFCIFIVAAGMAIFLKLDKHNSNKKK